MEVVGLSLNAALVRTPLSNSRASEDGFIKHSIFSTRTVPKSQKKRALVVEAKGKRGMQGRQFQRQPPPLPKIEDDGNPKFVIFIRMANVCTTPFLARLKAQPLSAPRLKAQPLLGYSALLAKTFTLLKRRALVGFLFLFCSIGWVEGGSGGGDEKEIQKTAFRQYRVLRSAKEFRYGYKLVENNNVRSALSTTDVIEVRIDFWAFII
ncbi:Protein HHL1, chloroplastic [Vitis vinifera]|uniref:Protein HHL1, chloroplastic n=1 Tax=Vitis vinifera TaxID=29760 RepID=A0A438EJA1_VITVI|nr:Protein HHL1, chloroplastic [Vitis vinifera]